MKYNVAIIGGGPQAIQQPKKLQLKAFLSSYLKKML